MDAAHIAISVGLDDGTDAKLSSVWAISAWDMSAAIISFLSGMAGGLKDSAIDARRRSNFEHDDECGLYHEGR